MPNKQYANTGLLKKSMWSSLLKFWMYQLPHDILKTAKTLLAAIHTLKSKQWKRSTKFHDISSVSLYEKGSRVISRLTLLSPINRPDHPFSSAKLRVKNFKTIEVLDPLLPSMAQGGKGKKLLSLLEKKDVANTARTAIRKEAEESNSMVIGSTTTVVGVLYYIYRNCLFIVTCPPCCVWRAYYSH